MTLREGLMVDDFHEIVDLEELMEEVGVTDPNDIHDGLAVSNCPKGWWGVWDENGGYIAYFQHEADAYAFRLMLITIRQQGAAIGKRYKRCFTRAHVGSPCVHCGAVK